MSNRYLEIYSERAGGGAGVKSRLPVVALAMALCWPLAGQAAEPLTVDEAVAQVAELAATALAEGAVGLSVAVSYGDEIILSRGFGLAEVEHEVDADSESIFRIGSITKQFTSALVMRRVEAGDIGLDDPISDYTDFPTGEHAVTVRHLLTHTSGIKSYTGLGEDWLKTIPLELTHDELLDLVDDLPFDFAPGSSYRYNNTGYYLLGTILESVSGKTYAELVAEEIAVPLGLKRTRYGSNGDVIKNRAQGYLFAEGALSNDGLIGMSQPGAAGAIVSTAGDLLRWQRALIDGKVVSAESYKQMTTPYEPTDGSETGYGFGLGVGDKDGLWVVQHGGGINGFSSMLAHVPETDVGIAVISNNEAYRAGPLATQINRAIHGIVIEILDEAVPISEQERLAGDYAFESIPLEMTVRARGEHLFIQATGQPESRVLRQGEGVYRASFDNEVVIEFSAGDPSPSLVLRQGGAFKAVRKE